MDAYEIGCRAITLLMEAYDAILWAGERDREWARKQLQEVEGAIEALASGEADPEAYYGHVKDQILIAVRDGLRLALSKPQEDTD